MILRSVKFILIIMVMGCLYTEPQPDVSDLIQSSRQALESRDYFQSLNLADSVLTLYHNSSDAHFLRGRIYFELQQWDLAEAAYLIVLDLEPDYPGVHHNLGNIYYSQRNYQSALSEFLLAVQDRPSAMSWHAAGSAYHALNQLDNASSAFKQSIATDSLYRPVLTSYADLLEQQGRHLESLKYSQLALQLEPDHFPDKIRLARLFLSSGQLDEVITLLKPLLPQYPNDAESRYILGQALDRQGFSQQSRSLLLKSDSLRQMDQRAGQLANIAENQPKNFQAQIDYAIFLRSSGKLHKAMTRYLIAQALRPNNMSLQLHLATLEIDIDDLEHAEKRLHRILAVDSSSVVAWLALEQVYSKTQRFYEAKDAIKQAVRINPNHPAVKRFLVQE